MIYTTYYANLRKLPDDIVPIAISRGVPKWFKGHIYSKLAPSWSLVSAWKENGNETEYRKEYKKILDNLNVHTVIKELYAFEDTCDIALVCYEKPSDFCHRQLVAEWLSENGFSCKEFNADLYVPTKYFKAKGNIDV